LPCSISPLNLTLTNVSVPGTKLALSASLRSQAKFKVINRSMVS
jgi:hypothetical protein